MAIPGSGKVSIGDIRTELQNSIPDFSLENAGRPETGAPGTFMTALYVPINQSSTSKPDDVSPYAISEWRNYNHSENKPCSSSSFTTPTLGPFYTYYRVDISGTAQYESVITVTGNGTAANYALIYTSYPFDENGDINIYPLVNLTFFGSSTQYFRIGITGATQILHLVFCETLE